MVVGHTYCKYVVIGEIIGLLCDAILNYLVTVKSKYYKIIMESLKESSIIWRRASVLARVQQ